VWDGIGKDLERKWEVEGDVEEVGRE